MTTRARCKELELNLYEGWLEGKSVADLAAAFVLPKTKIEQTLRDVVRLVELSRLKRIEAQIRAIYEG